MSEYILPLFVSNRYPSPRYIPIYHAFRTRNTMIFPFRLRFSLSLAVTDLSQAQRPCAGQRQTLNQQFFSPTTAITTRRTRNNIYISVRRISSPPSGNLSTLIKFPSYIWPINREYRFEKCFFWTFVPSPSSWKYSILLSLYRI